MVGFLPFIILAIVIAALWVWMGRGTETRLRRGRILLGAGLGIAGAVLALRGAVVLGGPVGLLGLGILGDILRPRGQAGAGGADSSSSGRPSSAEMSPAEARDLLGVETGADERAIRAAARSLLKRVHPDTGGSEGLTRKILEAQAVLLREIGE